MREYVHQHEEALQEPARLRMLKEVVASAGLLLCSVPVAVLAQQERGQTSGAAMLNACRDFEALRDDARTSNFMQGYCAGAVIAAALLHDQVKFCIPGPVPKVQLVRIVIDYLQRNPAQQHLELAVLASYALAGAYPCSTVRRR
ncbi:Rap1a/Tai family immunity protein [Reyranella sp.]|uniref:Rap1a/Tai family immunity protein n=1 Tax=Reyranella sp. TaxID=1929291 RepID=UPI003D10B4F1